MDIQECIITHLVECGLKRVGRYSNKKTRLLRFRKNNIKYDVVLNYDTCIVHIWKWLSLDSCKPIIVDLHDPDSLERISNFV